MGPGDSFHMGWMWLWWLLLLAGMAAVAVGLVLAIRSVGGSGRGDTSGQRSPARQILDERFARGEIDEKEYRARREGLDER